MINLRQNFALIVRTLQEKEQMKLTQIARDMGYTTTSQLHGAIDGESMLSTKAIIALIEKLNVNPTYLFLGKGEMFLSEESELDSLQEKCSDWERKYFDVYSGQTDPSFRIIDPPPPEANPVRAMVSGYQ